MLELLGKKVTFNPIITVGENVYAFLPVDVYIRESQPPVLLTFRGGPWKPWWGEDLYALGALVRHCTTYAVEEAVVAHEVEGELNLVSYPLEADTELVLWMTQKWAASDRISKSAHRGRAWCPRCPVRHQCDQMDVQENHMADWPKGYIPA